MKRKPEFVRYFPITDVRAEDDGALKIGGYAAVFNSLSEPIGGMFREVIRRGAFTKTLQESDVVAVWNHDTGEPLGRRSNGTLSLDEDEHGLRFDLTMASTQRGRDAHELIRRGDVKEMSFGFAVVKERWTRDASAAMDTRELLEVALFEISPVTFPAYAATEVEARGVFERRTQRNTEFHETTEEPGTNANHSEAGTDVAALLLEQQLIEMEATLCLP